MDGESITDPDGGQTSGNHPKKVKGPPKPMADIQSWWEVPNIAHFCSLFRVAFNLLDFDIEELEEALLTDGAELTGSSLLQELIVRLLCGCLGNNGISIFNYQMFLRRLFRTKCRELDRDNPFDTDIDFQFLPLRTKVKILHALCDFRLDADDVIDVLKNLDSDSLRVHPLGYDENKSAYWYFYGTRLYREDFSRKRKKKRDSEKQKQKRKHGEDGSSSEDDDDPKCGTWRVLCFTQNDWQKLAESMANSNCKDEQALYAVLTEDFLPEIPRLFEEKERLQRKRLLEHHPRRTSSRLEKLKNQQQLQRAEKHEKMGVKSREERYLERARMANKKLRLQERRNARVLRRSRSKSESGSSAGESSNMHYTGRQTNNSLSSATGKIIIQPMRQKFHTSQLFRRTKEDLLTGLYKVLDRLKTHEDAWPFVDPVEEEYAPKYYSVIAKPMDLKTMEDKLDDGQYGSLQQFRSDFKLIVDNCRQYNGSDNEYTQMVNRLHEAFQALVDRYFEIEASSEDEPGPELVHRNKMDLDSPVSSVDGHRRSLSYDSQSDNENEKKNTLEDEVVGRENYKPEDVEETGNDDNIDDRFDALTKSKSIKKTSPKDKRIIVDRKEEKQLCNVAEDDITKSRETSQERGIREAKARAVNYKEIDEDNLSCGEGVEQEEEEFSDFDDVDIRGVGYSSSRGGVKKFIPRKPIKKAGVIRNVAAIEALELATEETLKDINKWLDDTPRLTEFSSNSNSPLHIPSTEEMANIEGEYRRRLQLDKPTRLRDRLSNDLHRRKMLKEQLGLKRRREVQRTIDRLQPGKSKGNLLSKENVQESLGSEAKFQLGIDCDESTPKLSLGKVLPTDLLSFGICDAPKKDSEDDCTQGKMITEEENIIKSTFKSEEKVKEEEELNEEPLLVDVNKREEKVEKAEQKKEKVTPNLSAWLKAFGAPKPQNNVKKKLESEESKPPEIPKPLKEDESLPVDDEKDKKINLVLSPARRQRKTSTGSSVSERSSFSQEPLDGNSPRPSLDEPYVSPQPEVKTYYHSPVNGTIKVGFYQDTCFPKGSSEKSSSPRELPSCSPRDLPSASPRTPYCSPRNVPSPNSPPGQSPKSDYGQVYPQPGVYSTVAHYPYFDTSKPIVDQYRNVEKSTPVYPVKKRAYSEVSPEHSSFKSASGGGGGSFTPTKGAMDQERTFNPTPGRMPNNSIRVGETSPLPIGLSRRPLHLIDAFPEDRQHFFGSDGIYKGQHPPTTMYSQTVSTGFSRGQKEGKESPQSYGCMMSPYRSEDYQGSPDSIPGHKSPFPSRTSSPDDSSPTAPINYSNVDSSKEVPTTITFLNRGQELKPHDSPVHYGKVTTPFSYASNSLTDIFPGKVNHASSFAGPISQLTSGIGFPTNSDLGKMRVPPSSLAMFTSQAELSKMNYPIADIVGQGSTSRFNYQELIQGSGKSAGGVYSQAMQDLIQSKATPPGMLPNVIPPYNRPVADIISSPSPKPAKKSRKKKTCESSPSSGFQQYIPPTSEAMTLKTTAGSAFNFASPSSVKAYIEDMRASPYYTEGGGPTGGSAKSAAYFLGQRSSAYPHHHHPFMAPQYQQFLQRHPEELLRPMMLHQGLLPPPPPPPPSTFPTGFLGINRPSWL